MSDLRDTPPAWNMPDGVNASLWHYAHEPRLARDEDEYFRGHPLFRADAEALEQRFVEPAPLIDLGCGAGRLAARFAAKGFATTAVDLSHSMLARVREKDPRISLVRANLCRLDCFPESHFTYALMMFSTLGMIRGRAARRRALAGAARLLHPDGTLALHAHNLWLNLGDSQGRRWLVGQFWRAATGRGVAGDRKMMYRNVPGMEVHLYRWGELRADLIAAGLKIVESLPLDATSAEPIRWPRLAPAIRAGGWLVFAKKSPSPRWPTPDL